MVKVRLKGVHRVRRKLSNGKVREHHYAFRGGPRFWSSDSDVKIGSPEYMAAFAEHAQTPKPAQTSASAMIDAYLDSAEHRSLAARTRADYRKWALSLAAEFKDDPAVIFEDPESRGEVNRWRQAWAHSPKQYDYAGTVTTVILNWAREAGLIKRHHCDKLRKIYGTDRSENVWTPADLEAFRAKAPEWVWRILATAVETGLRPGDLIKLSWQHIEATPQGRRIRLRTAKRGRVASIPVTPGMAAILDATPTNRLTILASHRGRPLTEHRASEGVRQWRDKAGLSSHLRLQDARGTAATRLLRAGCSLSQIAAHMGWSLRHASSVIERYAAVAPEDADAVLTLLATCR
ncbi:MAG: tyrosine-type recombinase/integrase [Pseudomonadota bacterium]